MKLQKAKVQIGMRLLVSCLAAMLAGEATAYGGCFRPLNAAGDSTWYVAAGDLDGDGAPDLAVVNWSGHYVSVLRNQGDGTFPHEVRHTTGIGPRCVAIDDIDDGVLMGDAEIISLGVCVTEGRPPEHDHSAGGHRR